MNVRSDQINKQFDIAVLPCSEISEQDLAKVHELFGLIYREANHSYLDKSMQTLRYIATAKNGEILAGFALGDSLETDIPGLDQKQTVVLGGIGCISVDYRRLGLFSYLEQLATRGSGLNVKDKRILTCGRMAHPVGFHSMSKNPTVVPRPDRPITDWQKQVGIRVAQLYSVELDPQAFVVQGTGNPIGYPDIVVDVPESDWQVFKQVNRDKGDSLLGIAWSPDAPPGW